MSRLLDDLLAALDEEVDGATRLRERLHATPELGNEEHRTAEILVEALGGRGVERVAGTGLLASSDGGGNGVVVRAELDGLPIIERTGARYAATTGRMHACGHDVHMAALTAIFRAARTVRDLPVPLIALFQPCEEDYPSGARRILREDVLRAARAGTVVGVHVHPEVSWGAVSADPGPINASSDNIRIVVEGRGGHAAYPHRSEDPVAALCQIVVALQQLVARRIDPMHHGVVTIGSLRAGTIANVIPDGAEAKGTLRALEPDDRARLRALVSETVAHVARACGCRARVEVTEGEPGVVNDAGLVRSLRDLLPQSGFEPGPEMRSCGSDDFGYYGDVAPSLLAFVGLDGAPGWRSRALHHPQFLPPPDAVRMVARAQATAYAAAARRLSVSGGILRA